LIGRCRWAERSQIEETRPVVMGGNARTGFWRSLFRCQGAARGTRRLVTDLPHPDLPAGSGPVSPPLRRGRRARLRRWFPFQPPPRNRPPETGDRTGGGR